MEQGKRKHISSKVGFCLTETGYKTTEINRNKAYNLKEMKFPHD